MRIVWKLEIYRNSGTETRFVETASFDEVFALKQNLAGNNCYSIQQVCTVDRTGVVERKQKESAK